MTARPNAQQTQDFGEAPTRISRRAMLLRGGVAAIGVGGIAAAINQATQRRPGSVYWPVTPVPLGATSMAVWGGDLWIGNGQHLMRWPVHGDAAEWEVADIFSPVNAVACDGDTLVAGLGNSALSGSNAEVLRVNPLNGVQLWRFSTGLPVSAVALHSGSVLVGTSGTDGSGLHFLSAGDGSRQAPDASVAGGVNSMAVTAHGWVVGGDAARPVSTAGQGSLAVWSPSGLRLWQQLLPTPVVAVAADADLVVSGSNGSGTGIITAFDAATGMRRWGPRDVGSSVGALASTSKTLFVGTQTQVQALAIADGSVKWTFPVPREVYALATDGQFVYISTGDSLLGLWL